MQKLTKFSCSPSRNYPTVSNTQLRTFLQTLPVSRFTNRSFGEYYDEGDSEQNAAREHMGRFTSTQTLNRNKENTSQNSHRSSNTQNNTYLSSE